MAELTIRDIEPEIIDRLTQLAKQHQRSVEEEHKAILRGALLEDCTPDAKIEFEGFLASIPNVGNDDDFGRIQGTIRSVDLSE